jgi:hypothetical protein
MSALSAYVSIRQQNREARDGGITVSSAALTSARLLSVQILKKEKKIQDVAAFCQDVSNLQKKLQKT